MKTRFRVVTGALALTLLMSTAWSGKPTGPLEPTGAGINPVDPGALACPAGTTEFRDQFPDLILGTNAQTYSVFGEEFQKFFDVTVTITVNSDNSLGFAVDGGWVHQFVAKAGLAEIFYDYAPIDTFPEEPGIEGKISADTDLNKRRGGSQQASHLDFCLSPQELPPNTSLLQDCLEGDDGVPPGEIGEGGCNPSGFQIVEYPNALSGNVAEFMVTQTGAPATYTSGVCTGGFVAQDPRVDEAGNLIGPAYPLDLSTIFDLSGFFPEGEVLEGKAILQANTVGSPCLALVVGTSNFEFIDLTAALPNGGAYTVTQSPSSVPGMYTLPAIGPLNTDPTSPDYQPDLQFIEQASYQPTDKFLLIEEAASPFTSHVFNDSRVRGFDQSYYPLNTREVCLDLDPALVPGTDLYFEAVYECKIDLALEYFYTLEEAIVEADAMLNLIHPSVTRLLNHHSKALGQIKNEHYGRSLRYLGDLLDEILGAQWNVDYRNDAGNLIMRTENLIWRVEQLQVAKAALL